MKIERTRIHFFWDGFAAVTNLGSVYPYPPPPLLSCFRSRFIFRAAQTGNLVPKTFFAPKQNKKKIKINVNFRPFA